MQKTFNRTKSIRQLVDNLSYPEYVKTRAEIHALNPEKIGLFAEVYATYLYSMKPEIFKSKEALNKFLSKDDSTITSDKRSVELRAFNKLWNTIVANNQHIRSTLTDKDKKLIYKSTFFESIKGTDVKQSLRCKEEDSKKIFITCLIKAYEDIYKALARYPEFNSEDHVFGTKITDAEVLANDFEFGRLFNENLYKEKSKKTRKYVKKQTDNEIVREEPKEVQREAPKEIELEFDVPIDANDQPYERKLEVAEFNKKVVSTVKSLLYDRIANNTIDLISIFNGKQPLSIFSQTSDEKEDEETEPVKLDFVDSDLPNIIPGIFKPTDVDVKSAYKSLENEFNALVKCELKSNIVKTVKFPVKSAMIRDVAMIAEVNAREKDIPLYKILSSDAAKPKNVVINAAIVKLAVESYIEKLNNISVIRSPGSYIDKFFAVCLNPYQDVQKVKNVTKRRGRKPRQTVESEIQPEEDVEEYEDVEEVEEEIEEEAQPEEIEVVPTEPVVEETVQPTTATRPRRSRR